MTLMKSQQAQLGTPAKDFSLPSSDGKQYTLSDFTASKVLVIIFTCNHCPYAQAAKPKLHVVWEKYRHQSVQFVAINPNDSAQYAEDAIEHMKEEKYSYPFPYLRDEQQEIARAYGAVCTPDIFVYDHARALAYHGQIDDDRPGLTALAANVIFGKALSSKNTASSDLERALDALIAGKIPDIHQKPSMGCSIKWKNSA